jgi:hypothetical protein
LHPLRRLKDVVQTANGLSGDLAGTASNTLDFDLFSCSYPLNSMAIGGRIKLFAANNTHR